MPSARICSIECGTIDIPNPAATRCTIEEICGASCPRIGLNPARWQLAMMLSWKPGPIARGKSINVSCAKVASDTERSRRVLRRQHDPHRLLNERMNSNSVAVSERRPDESHVNRTAAQSLDQLRSVALHWQ